MIPLLILLLTAPNPRAHDMHEYSCELLGKVGKDGERRDPVIDGDTIDVLADLGFGVKMQLRLRLAGINTPESRTRNADEKARGMAAKAFLKEMLARGPLVFKSHEKGKYGRVLATVEVFQAATGWVNVNKAMLQAGHAVEYHGGRR